MDTFKLDRFEAAEKAVERIEYFRNLVGIDEKACKLSTYGLTDKDCQHMAKNTINDMCNEASARDWTEEDSLSVYQEMM
jgi:alcohol dehydrogenase class IV